MKDFNPKHLPAFKDWLTARGASVLSNTDEYEVLRFQTASPGVSVLYRRKTGQVTPTGEMKEAWTAFRTGQPFGTGTKTARPWRRPGKSKVIIATLLDRDGPNCFYCHKPLLDDCSVEHLLSLAHGGPDHVSNLVLAHSQCNSKTGHLSLIEKIRLRESNMCFSTCAYSLLSPWSPNEH